MIDRETRLPVDYIRSVIDGLRDKGLLLRDAEW